MTITAPKGFRAAGITAGIKASGKPDLALVVNDGPSKAAAAVFTSNRVAAAPVHWSRQVVSDGRVDAVVLNSGGANACTGPQGFQNTHATAEKVAAVLGISASDVVVCSTGLIGEQLPMDKIIPGVEAAAKELSEDGGAAAATAIMTTDSVSKEAVFAGKDAEGKPFTVGGIAKGAGMLAPGLATMLVVLTTDAEVPANELDVVLRDATRVTFDRADSDGCMSTNDTVVLLASGASEALPSAEQLSEAVTAVCAELARKLIGDAEGASHDIAIRTFNAASERDAETVSRSVARSNLFKAAIFGKDPNWGRVLSAVGTTDAVFEADQLNVAMNGIQICRNGAIGDDRNLVDLEPREVLVEIDLQAGDAEATIWTNDLTHDYVHENSAYSS
ncbi:MULTISPECIES: bifunctional glutamate N-acetyltransferase/amino-acid acetyltransferase ArgJ [Paenarthrobacter]|uniref:Arginine biosynthesis bifunctional protein ArgJ n=1 Tax=Paenarthrobacter nicotinovorans TaxID=29320 RepID=A0ABT9TQC7_PAENI|nr:MULTISPECIES: bifunctional glutamate N-acetyltransferase/amino-acid acetyltransferase ArgJ [Paenarthrobacter]KIA73784.1 ornithine acetyltransferase/N-acetylglutamate synthase [Arthrobacter sp. MWB30]KQQ97861.1 N-acetylglutamate synthase [Arthrobacter sp. Leaf145]SKB88343.1 glutamate N-acetyltransferase [Arthrobacter sp. 31Cvi3.1E]BCW40046.1 arginine biosynthesis bifunctional protein ArgJ [Arthrobacter sp. StoSoilB3]MBP2393036.1 glutamate N-acetyltransferase/amino-acid N-acetyltransferase [P